MFIFRNYSLNDTFSYQNFNANKYIYQNSKFSLLLSAKGFKKNQQITDYALNLFIKYESPEGTWRFSKKAISKSLYRIVQSVLTD